MKRLALAGALLLALAVPAVSSGVRHNRISKDGIGPVRLGMDLAAAKKAIRQIRAGTLRSVETTDLHGGLVYREYNYYRGYGIDSYLVGFLGPKGKPKKQHIARIVTFVPADRTARGAHVGTTLRTLYRIYRGSMRCGQTIYLGRPTSYTPCRVGAASKRHIVLLVSNNDTSPSSIGRIILQQPGLGVPVVT
jgi:hypothetical protein